MTDLYITYGLRETLWVNQLVRRLDSEGYTVFWEHAAAPGNDVRSDDSIQALNAAACVLAVWSDTAVDDHWVLSDAQRAIAQQKLISVVAKSAVIPRDIRRSETVFMQNREASGDDTERYAALLSAISARVKPSRASQSEREQAHRARQQRMRAESQRRQKMQQAREERARLKRQQLAS